MTKIQVFNYVSMFLNICFLVYVLVRTDESNLYIKFKKFLREFYNQPTACHIDVENESNGLPGTVLVSTRGSIAVYPVTVTVTEIQPIIKNI